ncbi:MAG: CBS domain-containing protein, partial [Polyangiaceae bacterium]|nr:CBS domain-containing protein [Polyangiaceae bacterium]
VVALEKQASREELGALIREKGEWRMPVYEGTLDRVLGYVTMRELLERALETGTIELEPILRPVRFVPASMRATALLDEMREQRAKLAVVIDEQGGTSGIVTMEDLLEELVGEVLSERDAEAPQKIRREPGGSFLVDGDVPVRDLNRELDIELPESPEWSTIAGVCLELGGRIPLVGERYELADGIVLEVVEASPRRVRRVRIRPSAREGEE